LAVRTRRLAIELVLGDTVERHGCMRRAEGGRGHPRPWPSAACGLTGGESVDAAQTQVLIG
jgi:hypothetical protein